MDMLFGALLALSLIALVWPFLIYPALLSLLPSKRIERTKGHRASTSLLFCAYNEGAAMPGKIANLAMLKGRHPDLEIFAFDDRSADDTADQLAARPDLVTLLRGEGRSGKAHGMKRMAAQAKGDILIFTDANVMLAPDTIDQLLSYYADDRIGGVLGSLHYVKEEGGSATAAVGSLYWRIEEQLKDLESRSGNVMGADGSIFSIRRSLYPDFPDTVLDDMTVSMAVVFAGRRLIKAKDVVATEALVSARGDEYRRKVRIATRSWHTHQYLRPQLRSMAMIDRFKYASRKILRWYGALFLAVGGLSAAALLWRLSPYALGGAVAAGLLFLLAGALLRRGPVAAIMDILIAYIATLQGVLRAMRGGVMATWAPAKSR